MIYSTKFGYPNVNNVELRTMRLSSTRLSSERLLILPVADNFSKHNFSRHFHQCENTLYKFAPLTIQYNRI